MHMNKYYIGLGLVVLIFGILVIPEIVDRVQHKETVTSSRSDGREERAASRKDLAYIGSEGARRKVPDFQFVNQRGDTITDEDYLGKVYVVEFFFSTCPSICPIMKKNLLEVQEVFMKENDFGIASFSIDPAHDTPKVLQEYADRIGVKHPNWNLMTGSREEIYDLANTGFSLFAGEDEEAEGGFAHSGYFALVDKEGFIRSRRDEFGNPIIYYKGSIPMGTPAAPSGERPQVDILISDIKKLL